MDSKDITKEYTNGELTVVWQAGKCIHSVIVFAIIQMFFNQRKTFDKKLRLRHQKNKRNGRQMSIGCIDLFSKYP
jgi:hypothetical protein